MKIILNSDEELQQEAIKLAKSLLSDDEKNVQHYSNESKVTFHSFEFILNEIFELEQYQQLLLLSNEDVILSWLNLVMLFSRYNPTLTKMLNNCISKDLNNTNGMYFKIDLQSRNVDRIYSWLLYFNNY